MTPAPKSRLRLRTERLAELTIDELSAVAAGNNITQNGCLTGTETYGCPTRPGGISYSCFTQTLPTTS